ncbi:MAG: hypothetical protein CSA75_05595 [Sorangium cellulosum]|nr:MAG: hypothetical protein CSA75_05595 [Sorangium cellulosum]
MIDDFVAVRHVASSALLDAREGGYDSRLAMVENRFLPLEVEFSLQSIREGFVRPIKMNQCGAHCTDFKSTPSLYIS